MLVFRLTVQSFQGTGRTLMRKRLSSSARKIWRHSRFRRRFSSLILSLKQRLAKSRGGSFLSTSLHRYLLLRCPNLEPKLLLVSLGSLNCVAEALNNAHQNIYSSGWQCCRLLQLQLVFMILLISAEEYECFLVVP